MTDLDIDLTTTDGACSLPYCGNRMTQRVDVTHLVREFSEPTAGVELCAQHAFESLAAQQYSELTLSIA